MKIMDEKCHCRHFSFILLGSLASKWSLLKNKRDEKVYPVKSCLAHTGEAGISPKAKLFNRTRKTGIKMLVKSIFIISGKRG